MFKFGAAQQKLNAIWYYREPSILNVLLIPLSFLFKIYYTLRCLCFRPATKKNPVPVIVIGNLTVGGSGKTPAIIALVKLLQQNGFKPGVISRGYPLNPTKPVQVHDTSSAKEVGDEALLIFKHTKTPVCVCRDRNAAIQALAQQGVTPILSDDGLQNLSFKHDLELVLYDQTLQFGNQKLLPAGPLREPLSRLNQVDFLLEKQLIPQTAEIPLFPWHTKKTMYPFTLPCAGFVRLKDWQATPIQFITADYFQPKKVIAITAIAHPEQFFASLTAQKILYHPVIFRDHYAFEAKDFADYKDCEIIMTEKDAVKCLTFCTEHFWYMPLIGGFSTAFEQAFIKSIIRLV